MSSRRCVSWAAGREVGRGPETGQLGRVGGGSESKNLEMPAVLVSQGLGEPGGDQLRVWGGGPRDMPKGQCREGRTGGPALADPVQILCRGKSPTHLAVLAVFPREDLSFVIYEMRINILTNHHE